MILLAIFSGVYCVHLYSPAVRCVGLRLGSREQSEEETLRRFSYIVGTRCLTEQSILIHCKRKS